MKPFQTKPAEATTSELGRNSKDLTSCSVARGGLRLVAAVVATGLLTFNAVGIAPDITVSTGLGAAEVCNVVVGTCLTGDDSGETVLAVHVDGATGNTGKLVARKEGLFSVWDASLMSANQVAAAFLPSHYFARACIRNTAAPSDFCVGDNSRNGARAGEIHLTDFVPKVNIQWTMVVWASEITIEKKSTTNTNTHQVTRWDVQGSFEQEVSADLDLTKVAAGGLPEVAARTTYGLTAGYEVTTTTVREETTEVFVKERQAQMYGGENLYVSLITKITHLDWDGDDFGCDALDLVESLIGERQIGDYAIRMASQGASTGELSTNYGSSEQDQVTSVGDFDSVIRHRNGLTALWDDSDGTFDSSIGFRVNYEHPEGLVTGLVAFPGGYYLHFDGGSSGEAASLLLNAGNTNIPAEAFKAVAAALTKQDIIDAGMNLGAAIGLAFLHDRDLALHGLLGGGCGSNLIEPMDHQEWTADGKIAGASAGASATSLLGVDVFLDLSHGGQS